MLVKLTTELCSYSNKTLTYLKSRKEMWKSQAIKNNSNSNKIIFEFDANNLTDFYDNNDDYNSGKEQQQQQK